MDPSTPHLLAFVKNREEVLGIHHPATAADVTTHQDGALRVTDYDGEVHIYAAGTWTTAKVEDRS